MQTSGYPINQWRSCKVEKKKTCFKRKKKKTCLPLKEPTMKHN